MYAHMYQNQFKEMRQICLGQMDHQIPAKRPDLVLINKEKTYLVDFTVPTNYRVKIKKAKNRHILDDGDVNSN